MARPMNKLWPHQVVGIKFLCFHKRVILADEMGVAKTRQVIETLQAEPDLDSVLVLCGKNAMYVWLMELEKWAPDLAEKFVTTEGKTSWGRQVVWKNEKFILCTPQAFIRDVKYIPRVWSAVICDEYHKFLRNRKTKTFKALKKLRSILLILMSGTPSSRGAQDLWPALHLINPKVFPSYWRFVGAFCYVDQSPFGQQVYGTRNGPALKDVLKNYLIRRLKRDVFKGMPPLLPQSIPLEMTPTQARLHKGLKENLMAGLAGGFIMAQNTLVAGVRLRQLLVSPRLLDEGAELGAGISYLEEVAEDLKHFVVFTPFRSALPIIGEALERKGLKVNYIQGGMSTSEIAEEIDQFNEFKSAIVCVIKCAESFSFSSASSAYFLGSEWDPKENEQAEHRLHRPDQKETVNIYYLQHMDSIEQDVAETLDDKNRNISKVLRNPYTILEMTYGAKKS